VGRGTGGTGPFRHLIGSFPPPPCPPSQPHIASRARTVRAGRFRRVIAPFCGRNLLLLSFTTSSRKHVAVLLSRNNSWSACSERGVTNLILYARQPTSCGRQRAATQCATSSI